MTAPYGPALWTTLVAVVVAGVAVHSTVLSRRSVDRGIHEMAKRETLPKPTV